MLASLPALPLVSFLVLLLGGSHLKRGLTQFIGVVMIFASFLMTAFISLSYLEVLRQGQAYDEILWTWIAPINIAFRFDKLSLLMSLVVSSVSTLVALYSIKFMEEDQDLGRYFAAINLFVCSMLILVLADNMLLMFAGFEGVGVCSYLLIGFWYEKSGALEAANKAFITTRLGDIFFLLGIVSLFLTCGTLNISEIISLAPEKWAHNNELATMTTMFLLAGAVGKSAQVPLQTWLPDAMFGPTPVSALIHAATMVTAGVYLLARCAPLLSLAPITGEVVLIIGAVSMLIGSFSALAQNDLKRVLAYSTMSQLGLMFMALGLGAWQTAMFHFMTHAFFKALLFLAAGVVGQALHHNYDMQKMGGLRKKMPFTFLCFLIGSIALSALPYLSAGFFSKELIMNEAFRAGSLWWSIGICGAFLTALYTFRMLMLVFFGLGDHQVDYKPTWLMKVPLAILAVASLSAGALEKPFLDFFGYAHHQVTPLSVVVACLASIMGMLLALVIFNKRFYTLRLFAKGFAFDALYELLIIRPYNALAKMLKNDAFTVIYIELASLTVFLNKLLSRTQSGRLRHYLTIVIASAIALAGLLVLS